MTLSLCQQTLTIQRIYFILCDRDQFEFNIIWKSFKTTILIQLEHIYTVIVFVVVFVLSVHAFCV